MKYIKIFFLLFIIIILVTGCSKKFDLEKKYYGKSDLVELDKNNLNKLINNKESFVVFFYQPMCVTSNDFSKIVSNYSEKKELTIYKMSYSLIKESDLSEYIKYYPSFVILKNGKVIDFLDANNDEHIKYYKNIDDFSEWLESYINI